MLSEIDLETLAYVAVASVLALRALLRAMFLLIAICRADKRDIPKVVKVARSKDQKAGR